MTQDEISEIDEARNIAVTFGTRMCDEHGDTHGEELYCVGIDDIRAIIKLVAAKERAGCVKRAKVALLGTLQTTSDRVLAAIRKDAP